MTPSNRQIITLEPRDISTSKRFNDHIIETFFRGFTECGKSYRLTTKKRLNGKISTHLQAGTEIKDGDKIFFSCNTFEDRLHELIEVAYVPKNGTILDAIKAQHKACIETVKKLILIEISKTNITTTANTNGITTTSGSNPII